MRFDPSVEVVGVDRRRWPVAPHQFGNGVGEHAQQVRYRHLARCGCRSRKRSQPSDGVLVETVNRRHQSKPLERIDGASRHGRRSVQHPERGRRSSGASSPKATCGSLWLRIEIDASDQINRGGSQPQGWPSRYRSKSLLPCKLRPTPPRRLRHQHAPEDISRARFAQRPCIRRARLAALQFVRCSKRTVSN